ncbi:MAG: methyltransferase domain-containing protein [Chlorobiaceae bacterium]
MSRDYEVFEQALTLFHRYSLQNDLLVEKMKKLGILPEILNAGFSVFDIGAGQGHLPDLMQRYVGKLILLEPNPQCVDMLSKRFDNVYPYPWESSSLERVRNDHPDGFNLVTMSHMLYHFEGINDVREKVRMSLSLVKTGGNLAIVVNQPSAPTAIVGVSYQEAEGRVDEARTNRELHAIINDSGFFSELSGRHFDVSIYPIDTPLTGVSSREELITLFRMPILNPLSKAACNLQKIDSFIEAFIDTHYQGLSYPAVIPSRDNLIVLHNRGAC